MNNETKVNETKDAEGQSRLNAGLDFPTWEDAIAGITDDRFCGHPKLDKQLTIAARAGARIMYDRLYTLMKSNVNYPPNGA